MVSNKVRKITIENKVRNIIKTMKIEKGKEKEKSQREKTLNQIWFYQIYMELVV